MAFCTECGKDIFDEAKFCPNCGTPQTNFEVSDPGNSNTLKANASNLYGAVNLDRLPEGYVINDRYEVKEKLGQGGFAAVYRVYDRNVETDKALKVFIDAFSNDKEAVEDLRREGKIMMNLTHERIVRIFDVHTTGSIKYIDMEYVDGKSLAEYKLTFDDRKVPEQTVLELGKKIAEGLSYAHGKRVIHKDLKPQNILVKEDGEIKITDFGISDCIRSSMSRVANTTSSGTLAYMAPEQVRGEDVGIEADIYGFGILLYELLAGHPPFYKGDIHYQIFNTPPAEIEGVSNSTNKILRKFIEKDYKIRNLDFSIIYDNVENREILEEDIVTSEKTQPSSFGERKINNETMLNKNSTQTIYRFIAKVFKIVCIFFIAIILLLIINEWLSNFTYSESMYSVTDVALWRNINEGTVIGVNFTLINYSNNFTIRTVEVKVDLKNKDGTVFNGFTQYKTITIPPNSAREVDLKRSSPILRNLPPEDEWRWDYEMKVKGTLF
jgi:serine/threonine protein kinase